jgi:poly-gamma-glutamate capsule biosynthesis protein CapA/YwtB (metallophosphatase superfamily)
MKARLFSSAVATVLLLFALSSPALGQSSDTPRGDPTIELTYLRGTDRFDTAMRISRAMFPGALPPGSGLVLAPGMTFPEALCGAPLAAAYGGPLLLTPSTGINSGIVAEIRRLQPQYVVCVGLSGGVVAEVQTALDPSVTVTSLSGADIYEMSYNVARALGDRVGDMSDATGVITIGTRFPDAIGVSPLACAKKWPILLTEAGDDSPLNAHAAQALAELGITKALKVGTYVTLPVSVECLANLSGSDRYFTNRNVVNWARANAGLSFAHTGLATGDKFPDALAAGPYLALSNGLLLLTPLYGPIPQCVAATLESNAAEIERLSFIAMIEVVLRQARSLAGLRGQPPFPPTDTTLLTVAAGGDVLGGRMVAPYIDTYGGEALFANIKQFLTPADVTFVNLEGPISDLGSPIWPSGPVFRARPALMQGLLSAGVDVVSVGNNHMLDYGAVALLDCINRLDAAGVKHAGAGANLAAAFAPTIWDTPAGKVALLAYDDINDSLYGATASKPGVAPFPPSSVMLAQISAAAQQSDFLIVSFHWGVESDYTVNAAERNLAHKVIDAGADLILGQHPHVVQGLEIYKNKLISYSLGNFVFDHHRTDWGESFILQVILSKDGPPRGEIIPAYLSSAGVPSPVTGGAAGVTLNRLTSLSAALGLTITRWGDQAFFGYP